MSEPSLSKIEWVAFAGGMIGAFFFNSIIYFFMMWRLPGFYESLLTGHLLTSGDLSNLAPQTMKVLRSLASQGVVTTPDEILAVTADFYEVLVIVLVSLLGLFGVIAFLYVRAISRANAEEIASISGEKAMKIHIKSAAFKSEFEKAIEDRTTDLNDRLEKLDGLDSRLQNIEQAIKSRDKVEEVPEEQIPSPENDNGAH